MNACDCERFALWVCATLAAHACAFVLGGTCEGGTCMERVYVLVGGALTVRVCVAAWQEKRTALMVAAEKVHVDVVRSLLEKGANADLQRIVSLVCVLCVCMCMCVCVCALVGPSPTPKSECGASSTHTQTVCICVYVRACARVVVVCL